ncbi:Chain length determinant protein [compost metagenome]
MSDSRVTFLGGPTPGEPVRLGTVPFFLKPTAIAFAVVVLLPTLVAAIYFLFVASPRYVSEAHFVVQMASKQQPSGLGVALQGVGISTNGTDSFAVHEYIRSRDALTTLQPRLNVQAMLSRPGVDVFSRFPAPGQGRTNEDLYKAFQRRVTVGYDTATGISTLRVQAFTPEDSRAIASALLDSGEALVNRLNDRAAAQDVEDAERSVLEAEQRLGDIQQRLTAYRNRESMLDPEVSAREGSALLGELQGTLASLRAERALIASQAPQSPQLPALDARIRAYEQQLAIERGKVAGDADSLATKVSGYEALMLERTLADRALTAASTARDAARDAARRQKLYLERVVNPNLPDKATEPRRWRGILAVLVTTLLLYGVGGLVWAGLREHRQL